MLFLLLDGCVEVVGLDELYEVKDHSDNQQEEQAEPPSNKQVLHSILRVLQILIDDFPWLGSLLNYNLALPSGEIFIELAAFLIGFCLAEEVLLLSFSLKDNNSVV